MIAFLIGRVEIKGDNFVAINVNGVGYKVFMPTTEIQQIQEQVNIKIYTYLRITQDDMSLFGFLNKEKLAMFELLIGVGGIGAKSAVNILSNIEPYEFAIAVVTNNIKELKKLPGIGEKTAQRIILELKDKLKDTSTEDNNTEEFKARIKDDEKMKDAIDALQVLGYNRTEIERVMKKLDASRMEVEEIIKKSLLLLAN